MNQIESREHKVKCNYGLPQYYKAYKKNSKDPKSSKVYSAVLKDYLNANRNAVFNFGYIYVLPQRMGRIEIRKNKAEVKIDKNGKIINKLAPNWQATKRLWAENKEAKKKKIVIKYTNEHTDGYIFRPRYIKNTANYKNKSIYRMQVNREMRRNTNSAIMNKRLDAFLDHEKI